MRKYLPLHLQLSRCTRSFPTVSHNRLLFQLHRAGLYIRHSSSDSTSASSETTSTDKRTTIITPTTIPVEPVSATAASPRVGPFTATYRAYNRSQAQHPYWTQFFSALVIYLLADASAQSLATQDNGKEDASWDLPRTARNLVIGGIASIPGYKWFMFLSRNFNYSSWLRSITTKVVVNQIVFAPVFNTYYFGMSCLLAGGSPEQVVQRITDTVPSSLVNSLFVWPWFQFFNFTFVQAEMRALTSGLFAIGWQAYLSWLNKYAERRRRSSEQVPVEA